MGMVQLKVFQHAFLNIFDVSPRGLGFDPRQKHETSLFDTISTPVLYPHSLLLNIYRRYFLCWYSNRCVNPNRPSSGARLVIILPHVFMVRCFITHKANVTLQMWLQHTAVATCVYRYSNLQISIQKKVDAILQQ